MAIRSEDLHLSIPNASPLFSKLAISTQFKVSLDLVRRSASGNNLGLFEYLTNCGLFNDTTSTVRNMISYALKHHCQVLLLMFQKKWEVVKE